MKRQLKLKINQIKKIKVAAEYISSALSNLFNKCLLKGIFPQIKICKNNSIT